MPIQPMIVVYSNSSHAWLDPLASCPRRRSLAVQTSIGSHPPFEQTSSSSCYCEEMEFGGRSRYCTLWALETTRSRTTRSLPLAFATERCTLNPETCPRLWTPDIRQETPMKAILAIALVTLAAPAWAANPFTLVADARAKAQIVTGDDAPETVQFAARELQTFVAKMSGAELPIAARAAAGVPAIRLGPAARAVLPPDVLKGIRRDGYVISLAQGDLCIVGLDDAGPRTDIEALLAKGGNPQHARVGFQPRHALRRLPVARIVGYALVYAGPVRRACAPLEDLDVLGRRPRKPPLRQPLRQLLVPLDRQQFQQGLEEAHRHAGGSAPPSGSLRPRTGYGSCACAARRSRFL